MEDGKEKYIFLHGLGQTAASWDQVLATLSMQEAICPELFSLLNGQEVTYHNLFRQFERSCNEYDGKVNICGISLGAVLALHYALEHMQRVRSLVLIAPQYKMPKGMLSIQNIVFHLMPEAAFREMGLSKMDTIALTGSMIRLDFREQIGGLLCPTLILCGGRDRANKKAAIGMQREMLNARLSLIEQAGHEVNVEAPEELADLIEKFWTDVTV